MTDGDNEERPPSIRWDVVAGLIVIALGAAFLAVGKGLRPGVLNQMGPGYVPQSVSYILMGLGLLIAVRGFLAAPQQVDWPLARPVIVVLACPILFALLIGRAGLVVTVLVVASAARLAQPQKVDAEAVVMPVLLAVFCVVLFSILLNLSIPLWPQT